MIGMKKIKRIKWENIFTIAMVVFSTMSILKHIELNGVYDLLVVEVAVYAMATVGVRYVIKDIRVNPINWLLDK